VKMKEARSCLTTGALSVANGTVLEHFTSISRKLVTLRYHDFEMLRKLLPDVSKQSAAFAFRFMTIRREGIT
jgi:hypothetical protein